MSLPIEFTAANCVLRWQVANTMPSTGRLCIPFLVMRYAFALTPRSVRELMLLQG